MGKVTVTNIPGVNLGVMTKQGYSTLLRVLKMEPHHQMRFSVISRTVEQKVSVGKCMASDQRIDKSREDPNSPCKGGFSKQLKVDWRWSQRHNTKR